MNTKGTNQAMVKAATYPPSSVWSSDCGWVPESESLERKNIKASNENAIQNKVIKASWLSVEATSIASWRARSTSSSSERTFSSSTLQKRIHTLIGTGKRIVTSTPQNESWDYQSSSSNSSPGSPNSSSKAWIQTKQGGESYPKLWGK